MTDDKLRAALDEERARAEERLAVSQACLAIADRLGYPKNPVSRTIGRMVKRHKEELAALAASAPDGPAVSHEAPVSEAQANSGGGASAPDEGPLPAGHPDTWPGGTMHMPRPAVPVALDVERLATIINRLDCIMGDGEQPTGVSLGLDYGTAQEWAEAIVAALQEEDR